MKKITIITGAAAGIGKELAIQLNEQGHQVIALDIDFEGLKSLGNSIEKMQLDVADYQAVKQTFSDIFQKYRRIDYVYANAGIAVAGEIRDIDIIQWQKIISININGVINCATEAYSLMLRQGFGHIINTASLAGLVPSVTMGAYSTTKFAIVGFSRVLRAEAREFGINVTAVCPGYIKSNIYDNAIYNNVKKEAAMGINPFNLLETDAAVSKIINGVEANKELIIFPFYGKLIWLLYRYCYPILNLLNIKTLSDFRKIRLNS
ncbi:MAG: SDR family oxidoreductase [Bacteroidota bacterium]